MRSAAAIVAEAGADLIDINMGCPVRKVCKTGAGAAMLSDHDLAVRIASAAREGGGIPVTVKLRSGLRPRRPRGRSIWRCGSSRRRASPRSASIRGRPPPITRVGPTTRLARELAEQLEVPMIISGGLDTAEDAVHAYEASGADAVMIARGSLGNPWIFEQLRAAAAPMPSATR